MVDATELPPAGEVAEGAGEDPREDHQAQPQFPPVDHNQPHWRFPHWNTAKISKGETHFLYIDVPTSSSVHEEILKNRCQLYVWNVIVLHF